MAWVAWVRDWSDPLPNWRALVSRSTWPSAYARAKKYAAKQGDYEDNTARSQVDIVVLWDTWGLPNGPSSRTYWTLHETELEIEGGAPDPFKMQIT